MSAVVLAAAGLAAGLAFLAAGLQRIPDGCSAVAVARDRCRRLACVSGWVWCPPGVRHLVLVDMARRQMDCPPEWHAIPGWGTVRLGMTIGLTVGDPCRVAFQALLESAAHMGAPSRTHLVREIDWAADHVRAALPILVADVVRALGPDEEHAPSTSQLWPHLRSRLSAILEPYGLIVQEVWLRDMAAPASPEPDPV